jgi:hypothetical protein
VRDGPKQAASARPKEETVTKDLPEGVAYLEAYDRFCAGVQRVIEMPDRTIDQLHRCGAFVSGRYWTRTSDPIDVNDVLYQAELSGRPYSSPFGPPSY